MERQEVLHHINFLHNNHQLRVSTVDLEICFQQITCVIQKEVGKALKKIISWMSKRPNLNDAARKALILFIDRVKSRNQ